MLRANGSKFREYGYILDGDFSEIVKYLDEKGKMPDEGNIYVRDDVDMHNLSGIDEIKEKVFGGSQVEVGYCNGYNSLLNCLEYHACPEVNIAMCDLVLLLAKRSDIKDGIIESKKCKEFLIKKGEGVVLYPYTLHFSPCKITSQGFKCAVILSDGTNRDLSYKPTDPMLWKENKWLFAHADSKQAKMGAYIGIKGENREVKYNN